MAAHSIDVALPDDLQAFLAKPRCLDIALPKPGKLEINLPMGGTFKGIVDVTKAVPDDCSLTFSLLLQLAPFLASIECLIKVLKLLKPLIDVISGLTKPDPPKLVTAVPEFLSAAEDLVTNCIAKLFGAGIPIFVRDLLCLIIKVLGCLRDQLKSIAAMLGGIALQLQRATAEGNQELIEQLDCARQNAATSAAYTASAIEPITILLSLAQPFFELASAPAIAIPQIGSADDVEGLNKVVAALDELLKVLNGAADALGGCS
jgi:hypothetical protein